MQFSRKEYLKDMALLFRSAYDATLDRYIAALIKERKGPGVYISSKLIDSELKSLRKRHEEILNELEKI